MRVTLKDEVLQELEPQITEQRPVEALIEQAVVRMRGIGPQERHLVIGEETLTAIESRLRCPAIGTPQDLLRAIQFLADVGFPPISFEFTPAQLMELKDRAQREDLPVEIYAQRIVKAMIPLFFQTAPAQDAPRLKGKK